MSDIEIGSTVWGLDRYAESLIEEFVVSGDTTRSWEFKVRSVVPVKFPKKADPKGERWTGEFNIFARSLKLQIFPSLESAESALAIRLARRDEDFWRRTHQYAIGSRVRDDQDLPIETLREIAALIGYDPEAGK